MKPDRARVARGPDDDDDDELPIGDPGDDDWEDEDFEDDDEEPLQVRGTGGADVVRRADTGQRTG